MAGISYDYDERKKKLTEDDDCPIEKSELCYWLAEGDCDKCYVSKVKDPDTRLGMAKNWKIMLSNLPENVDDLGNSETCVFCKGEPNKTDCYATLDLAHPDPPAKKGLIFGFGKKVRIPVGSMFALKLACCKKCRNKMRMANLASGIIFVIMIAVGLLLGCLPDGPAYAAGGENILLMAFIYIVGFAVGGFFLGKAIGKQLTKNLAKTVKSDPREIPMVAEMFANRWFIYDSGKEANDARLFFSNKKDFKNVFPPEEFCVDSKIEE